MAVNQGPQISRTGLVSYYWCPTSPQSDMYTNGGSTSTSSERWFQGNIPLVRIYNRALSASEISQNFNVDRWRFGI